MRPTLILASNSPRRKELLKLARIKFEVFTKDVNETVPAEIPVEQVPLYLSRKKNDAYADIRNSKVVLTADTVVILHNQIVGKPKDLHDA